MLSHLADEMSSNSTTRKKGQYDTKARQKGRNRSISRPGEGTVSVLLNGKSPLCCVNNGIQTTEGNTLQEHDHLGLHQSFPYQMIEIN